MPFLGRERVILCEKRRASFQRQDKGGKDMIKYKRPTIVVIFCMLFTFAALTIFPATVGATPPSDVQLSYDLASKTLKVTISHASFMPTVHYIKTVEIKKNGAVTSTNNYNNQPDKSTFAYTYVLPAAEGDVLEVTATCRFYGSKTVDLKVAKP
jgi:hypothetical protein